MTRLFRTPLAAALVMVALSACGRGDQRARRVRATPVITPSPTSVSTPAAPTTAAPTTKPTERPPQGLGAVRVRLRQIATLDEPLAMEAPAGEDALYVAEKSGRVRAIRNGRLDPAAVVDVSGEISTGGEQGLLGLAFSPDRAFLYVHFTNRDGDTRIREYAFRDGRADVSTTRQVLEQDQPYENHNGGQIVFGPDGKLWIGLGDGGSGGDPHGNGQRLDTLLGKLLRIDPRGGQPYAVPPDNPFVGRSGARGEIWAYGLRNPWRFSFDRDTGDLWIGDVGQNDWEEIDFRAAGSRGGENYGWNRLEGKHKFKGDPPPDHVPPIFEYPLRGGACAVMGGYVYRGTRIPAMQGAYLFADFCVGRVRALVQRGGAVTEERALAPVQENLSSFGQDQSGELYVLSLNGPVFRLEPA